MPKLSLPDSLPEKALSGMSQGLLVLAALMRPLGAPASGLWRLFWAASCVALLAAGLGVLVVRLMWMGGLRRARLGGPVGVLVAGDAAAGDAAAAPGGVVCCAEAAPCWSWSLDGVVSCTCGAAGWARLRPVLRGPAALLLPLRGVAGSGLLAGESTSLLRLSSSLGLPACCWAVRLLELEPRDRVPELGAAGGEGLPAAEEGDGPGRPVRCLCSLPVLSLGASCALLLGSCLPCSLCDAVLPAAPVPVCALAAFRADVRGPSFTVFRGAARGAAAWEPAAAAAPVLRRSGPVPAEALRLGSGPDMLLLMLLLPSTALLPLLVRCRDCLPLLLARCRDCLLLMPPAWPSLLWNAPVWLLRRDAVVLPAAPAEAEDTRGLDSLRLSSAVHMLIESMDRLMLLAWRGCCPGRWKRRGRGCCATGEVTP